MQHLAFCPSGLLFFERPENTGVEEHLYPEVTRPLDAGWRRDIGPDWVMLMPERASLPGQGWKIHISATLDNAERVSDVTWAYAVERNIPFKFIRSRQVLMRRNGKYGDRSGSGKFVTIYPADEAQLATVLAELGALLDGEAGPYILSDLRWRSGPLYVRYGGFVPLVTRGATGDLVHCIVDPDGRLVPDQRTPGFRPPQWVTLPEVLQESLAARNAGTLKDFPYSVENALHFSNGGGIYRGTDGRTGERVLLREARPLAGVDSNGDDAVVRLKREYRMLQRMAGLPCVPRLIDYRMGHEHYFLVREYVDGDSLAVEINRRHPRCGEGLADEVAEYTRWATETLDRIEQGVSQMHGRGVFFGDLHPGNVMFRSDGSVCFIDFETASTDPQARQFQGAPGFVVPGDCRGPVADRFMLGCLRIAMFVPLSGILSWGPEKVDELVGFITSHFPVPADFASKVHAELSPGHWQQPPGDDRPTPARPFRFGTPTAVQDVVDGILATATTERDDRLFPGDAAQFFTPEGGTAFAYGAAGVLWALAEVGAAVPEPYVDWLQTAALRLTSAAPGFYNGLSGILFTLDRLGRPQAARELLERVRSQVADQQMDDVGSDLFSGLAGIGLTELHLAGRTGDQGGVERATAIARELLARSTGSSARRRSAPGLLRGQAGPALLMLRLSEETGDTAFLDAAQSLLHDDVRALGWTPEGTWSPGAIGHRLGVGVGSGGTAMVIHDLLAHRSDAQLAQVRDVVRQRVRRDLSRSVSLLQGQAATVLTMAHLDDEPDAATLATHGAYLQLMAVRNGDAVAFLGYEGLRLSTDLLTGAAGVLLVLDGMIMHRRRQLPFLASLPGETSV